MPKTKYNIVILDDNMIIQYLHVIMRLFSDVAALHTITAINI